MLLKLGDVTSILITLILKLTNIRFKTNDQLECVKKLIKIHKAQIGLKGIYQENQKSIKNNVMKIKIQDQVYIN